MFLQCGSFPVQLAKACLYQALFGDVDDECLLESFLHILPGAAADTLSSVICDKKPLLLDEVLDILDDYKEHTLPTADNLKSLIVKTARAELVTKPFSPLLKIREGTGLFWDCVTKDEIQALYESCSPSCSRVINFLHAVPQHFTRI